eukprot:4360384-Alexandrium_andersonii.AAC.1
MADDCLYRGGPSRKAEGWLLPRRFSVRAPVGLRRPSARLSTVSSTGRAPSHSLHVRPAAC